MAKCKVCKSASNRAWQDDNKAHLAEYARNRRQRPDVAEKVKAYRQTERARELARQREQLRSPTRKRYRAEYERRPHVKAYRSAYKSRDDRRQRTSDLAKRAELRAYRVEYHRTRRESMPRVALHKRMSDGIRSSLKGMKNGRWLSMVDYTLDDLVRQLERQFLPGMSWANFGHWHIDHIVPVADFQFTSHEDSEFKACWAMGNLRPLWSADNLSKSDKRIFLL